MDAAVWLVLALAFGFFAYLLYTRQFKWLVTVIRNITLGAAGFLLFNFLFSGIGMGLAVGVNAVTLVTVGLLGAPGFLMLYAAQMLMS